MVSVVKINNPVIKLDAISQHGSIRSQHSSVIGMEEIEVDCFDTNTCKFCNVSILPDE